MDGIGLAIDGLRERVQRFGVGVEGERVGGGEADVGGLGTALAEADLVGVFAWRKGTTRVIPIDNRALDFESNVDGIMQRLASEGPGAWFLHSRATPESGYYCRYVSETVWWHYLEGW